MVFGVENEMTNEEFAKAVYIKYLKNAGVSAEKYKERVRTASIKNRKGMMSGMRCWKCQNVYGMYW